MTHPRPHLSQRTFVLGAAGLGAAAVVPATAASAAAAAANRPARSNRRRAEQSRAAVPTCFRSDDGSGSDREQRRPHLVR